RCPRVVITTHLLEVFQNGLLRSSSNTTPDGSAETQPVEETCSALGSPPVLCEIMASTVTSGESSDIQDISPLFELQHGISTHSNALGCASTCGIPHDVVIRASEIMKSRKEGRPITPINIDGAVDLRHEDQLVLYFASIDDWTSASDENLTKF
uniref:Uncharacterized protein n=1 Tax=Globisporangium ultimum (strain ATCC 200006 / CBS 805.95 / DAOM BR144) TaxID=431595 RepID=K3X3Y6_GLOUD